MRWIRSSWWMALRWRSPTPDHAAQDAAAPAIEAIRQAMQELLESSGAAQPPLDARIAAAHDMETLWHLRGDLLRVLAAQRGEGAAYAAMDGVSRMFEMRFQQRRGRPRRD